MTTITDQQLIDLAVTGGWSGNDVFIAVAVALAENTSKDPTLTHHNVDGSIDYGLWQVNSVHGFDPKLLIDPIQNAILAHQVWSKEGWDAWSTFKSGAYLLFMPRAKALTPSKDAKPLPPGIPIGGNFDFGDNPLTAIASDVKFIGALLAAGTEWLSHAHNWARIGFVVLGGGMLLIGLADIASPLVKPIVDTASTVTKVAK
jgi:hypothetical protein